MSGLRSPKAAPAGNSKRGAGALFHVHQTGFNGGESSPVPRLSVAGLPSKVLMMSPAGPRQAVMQGEKGARLNPGKRAGHKSPDKLPSIVESQA